MTDDLNPNTPSSLVIEYKSTSLIAKSTLSMIAIIVLLMMTDASLNILALIVLGIWFVISLFWLKKANTDTALIITDQGIKIDHKQTIGWSDVENFFIKTVVVDGEEAERIIIKSSMKDFKLDMEDLNLDKEGLNRWIRFHKQNRGKIKVVK